MKKMMIALVLGVLVCGALSGCGTLTAPEESKVVADLRDYYRSVQYSIRDSAFSVALGTSVDLNRFDSVEYVEQELDQKSKSAYLKCIIVVVSSDESFAQIDTWDLFYTYNRGWELDESRCIESQYELRSDLSESSCEYLVQNWINEDIVIESVMTDRESHTASAVYSYQTMSGDFGEVGSIVMNARGDATLKWNPDGGWYVDTCQLNDSTEYLCNLTCHIEKKQMICWNQTNLRCRLICTSQTVSPPLRT